MAFWYYIPGIFVGIIGLLMMVFSSYENKWLMTWGITLLIIALVAEAAIWFASLV